MKNSIQPSKNIGLAIREILEQKVATEEQYTRAKAIVDQAPGRIQALEQAAVRITRGVLEDSGYTVKSGTMPEFEIVEGGIKIHFEEESKQQNLPLEKTNGLPVPAQYSHAVEVEAELEE